MLLALILTAGGLTACGGSTPISGPDPIVTPQPTVPANPGSVSATLSAQSVALTWGAVSGATSYKVDRKLGSGAFTEIATVSTTTYTDANLTAGAYSYRVRSVNATGASEGTVSSTVTVTAPTTTPVNSSRARAQEFVGTWLMNYTIISNYTDTLKYNQVYESTSEPGLWFAAGKDQGGSIAIAFYSNQYSKYVAASGPDALPTYYTFPSIGSDGAVRGVVYFDLGSTFSRDYTLLGKRTSTAIPTLSLSESAQAQVLFDKLHKKFKQ